METKRLNLTVDATAANILESLAGGRNKMGDHLSRMLISMAAGTTSDDLDRMDKESIKAMIQGLLGRVVMLEGEVLRLQSQLKSILADRAASGGAGIN